MSRENVSTEGKGTEIFRNLLVYKNREHWGLFLIRSLDPVSQNKSSVFYILYIYTHI